MTSDSAIISAFMQIFPSRCQANGHIPSQYNTTETAGIRFLKRVSVYIITYHEATRQYAVNYKYTRML